MAHKIIFFQILKNLFIENKIFVYLVIILGIFSIGAFNYSFVLLKSVDLGVEQNFVPIIYSIIYIIHTAIGITAGILSDKKRKSINNWISIVCNICIISIFFRKKVTLFIYYFNSINLWSISRYIWNCPEGTSF